jgi:hypothetical protein
MFRYFGYEFAFHSHYAPLRERLVNPDNWHWKTVILSLPDGLMPKEKRHSVFFSPDPGFIMAIMRFRPEKGCGRVLGVLLPGLETPEVPEIEKMTFNGGFVRFRPEAFFRNKGAFQSTWQATKRLMSSP